jgi:hypothetical protein
MSLKKPRPLLLGCSDIPSTVSVVLFVVLVGAILTGCTASSTQPTSNPPSTATATTLTDEQRVEEQAFDLWLAQLVQPQIVVQPQTSTSSGTALPCVTEGSPRDGLAQVEWCAQWAFQQSSIGQVNGSPLSGAAMVTINPSVAQRYVSTSWSCSGVDYLPTTPQGGGYVDKVSRAGTYSSTGIIEYSQIRISVVPRDITDAGRANGITWDGKLDINIVQRHRFSAEDFGHVGSFPGFLSLFPNVLPTMGQWSDYADIQSSAQVALQNGKLVTSAAYFWTSTGWSFDPSTNHYDQIAPGEAIFRFQLAGQVGPSSTLLSTASDPDLPRCL